MCLNTQQPKLMTYFFFNSSYKNIIAEFVMIFVRKLVLAY